MAEDMFECFSTAELIDAIKAFARAKRGLVVQRAITDGGDIDILSEQQVNVTHSFFKRVCLEWQNPIRELVLKKDIKNKYKNLFLFNFFSFCSTQEEALVILIMRKIIFFKEGKITILKRSDGVDISFFIESGRIKANFFNKKVFNFFLDENLT